MRRGLSLGALGASVEVSTRSAIATSRHLSRVAGMSRLEAEAASVGFELAKRSHVALSEVQRDLVRARTYARSYANRWLKLAENVGPEKASLKSVGSVRRIAATESAESFNSGRAKYLSVANTSYLARVWDSALDKRVCSVCSRAEGTIVRANEKFPFGEPGAVHPFCRCCWTLVTIHEVKRIQANAA